jgi:hypothetical protein
MSVPTTLTAAIHWWSSAYGDHHLVSVPIRFIHLLGLMVGGGTALFVDGSVLRAARQDAMDRTRVLSVLHLSHRIVVPALSIVVASGILMTLADADTLLHSTVYWVKSSLVLLLLINGYGIVRTERGGAPWPRLVTGAAVSLALWMAILFAGTLLTVAA